MRMYLLSLFISLFFGVSCFYMCKHNECMTHKYISFKFSIGTVVKLSISHAGLRVKASCSCYFVDLPVFERHYR